jgi:hypothetical protein
MRRLSLLLIWSDACEEARGSLGAPLRFYQRSPYCPPRDLFVPTDDNVPTDALLIAACRLHYSNPNAMQHQASTTQAQRISTTNYQMHETTKNELEDPHMHCDKY